MTKPYILALDQGTTSSRAILFDHDTRVVGAAQREFTQFYPQPGWVEHDPQEIWNTQSEVIFDVLGQTGARFDDVEAIGITNQRETTVVWERKTGKPVYRAIVWQCRRTAPLCEELAARGLAATIREKTGLVLDAYFSGTKIRWILDNVPDARERAEAGELAFGTVDSWLLWQLTGGRVHATDVSNASRTMIFNIDRLEWDEEILAELRIPRSMLPEVRPSSFVYGATAPQLFDGKEIPIAGVAGDQQAALFGQACFEPGSAKNTYGTGCFLMMNTGGRRIASRHGLLTTVAWQVDGSLAYALEGSIFVAGAAVQWLRDEMGLVRDARETEYFAQAIESAGGVYFVPAFVGLGAPYWDMYARGTIVGLTRGTGKNHVIRSALESIAYQTKDVLDVIAEDSGVEVAALRVDGGASANNFLMQFQADILGVPVIRPEVIETTALGAAYLAGLATGFWSDRDEIGSRWIAERTFVPSMDEETRARLYAGWRRAVDRARG